MESTGGGLMCYDFVLNVFKNLNPSFAVLMSQMCSLTSLMMLFSRAQKSINTTRHHGSSTLTSVLGVLGGVRIVPSVNDENQHTSVALVMSPT